MSARLIHPQDDPVRAAHVNQFAPRHSGLSIDHFARPWYTRRIWRWSAIAVLALSVIGLYLTQAAIASW